MIRTRRNNKGFIRNNGRNTNRAGPSHASRNKRTKNISKNQFNESVTDEENSTTDGGVESDQRRESSKSKDFRRYFIYKII